MAVDSLIQDLKYASRTLLRNPVYFITVSLTLALGIGVNISILTLINSAFLRPLPYRDADRMVTVWLARPGQSADKRPLYPPTLFLDLEEQQEVFEDIAAVVAGSSIGFDLVGGPSPERVPGAVVSANFFEVLGSQARIGRTFSGNEEASITDQQAIISDGLWRRRFNADQQIIGTAITLNGLSYTIVGVTDPETSFPRNVDVWVADPLRAERVMNTSLSITYGVEVVAHLKPGIDLKTAQSLLNLSRPDNAEFNIIPIQEHLFGSARPPLLLVWAAGLFMLLITCANVGSLAVTRIAARRYELAIRSGLGASRWALMRLILTENLLLAALGAAGGLILSFWGTAYLIDFHSGQLGQIVSPALDWRVFLATALLALITGLLFGLGPAVAASRPDALQALKEGSRNTTSSRGQRRVLRIMAICEIAFAMLLLIGAGLMSKTFVRLTTLDFGYDTDQALTMRVSLPSWKYDDNNKQQAFYDSVSERLKTAPGILHTAWTTNLPVIGGGFKVLFLIEGRPTVSIEDTPSTYCSGVTGDYFRAMGIPLIKGRLFTEQDTKNAAPAVIIDRVMASRFWPNEEAVGKRLNWQGQWREIVGVVGAVRSAGPEGQITPQMYVPYSQFGFPWPSMYLVARGATNPQDIITSAQMAIAGQDKDQPIMNVRTIQELISNSVERQSFSAALMGIFAVLSLSLSAMGVYAVMAYSVRQRIHEIGVRISLGATQGSVLRLIMSQGVRLITIGLIAGLISAVSLTHLLASLLYGVSPTDITIFFAAAIVVSGAALLACYLPARRATKVDPMAVLRTE